jgi:hypothetical protein
MADELKDALLEFLAKLRAAGVEVFLGGGYGLYLKQISLLDSPVRTYLDRVAWPRPRATADLDVFLPTEVITHHANMARVRAILDELGYESTLDYLHFVRQGPQGAVKIELLSGPVERSDKVKVSGFRIRSRNFGELHAYLTKEAIDLERDPVRVQLDGAVVFIPNPFAFLLMKLHAFRDRVNEPHDHDERQLGRHHALDVYRIIAMMTEPEETLVRQLCASHRTSGPFQEAARIVVESFAVPTSIGVLRLREHKLAGDFLDIGRFLDLLNDLFTSPGEPE